MPPTEKVNDDSNTAFPAARSRSFSRPTAGCRHAQRCHRDSLGKHQRQPDTTPIIAMCHAKRAHVAPGRMRIGTYAVEAVQRQRQPDRDR